MPRPVLTIAALLLVCHAAELRAADFPYKATVARLNVTARSGPTYGTYATERLAKHTQVEVYKDGPYGWLAIRPPEDAFDWLPASAVKRTPGQKGAVVIADDTPCYIGSNVKKIDEHLSQVMLKAGEKVWILDEKQTKRADGSTETWLKIAPPAGEFRWVQAKHLSTKSAEQLASEETAERLAREERYRRENAENPPGLLAKVMRDDELVGNGRRDEEVAQAQFLRRGILGRRSAAQEKKSGGDSAIPELKIEAGEPAAELAIDAEKESAEETKSDDEPLKPKKRISLDPEELIKTSPPLTSRDTARAKSEEKAVPQPEIKKETPSVAPPRRPIEAAEFKDLMSRLEVDLTVMVAQDSSKWNLAELRKRAEALVEDGPTATDRGRARLLLERIVEFESTLPPQQQEGLAATNPSPPSSSPVAETPKPEFETQYDAIGYLMPVIAARPGVPPYQLTDKEGHTLQYVSPAPGVNLNRYVKKQVGLYGQRGYVESLKKQHILADRVVDLDRHKR